MFTERGYAGVSMSAVARAAGISKGLLYHYFPSKRAFFAATLEAAAQELAAVTETDPDAAAAGPGRAGPGRLPGLDRRARRRLPGRLLDGAGERASAWSSESARPPPSGSSTACARRAKRRKAELEIAVQGWLWAIDGACLQLAGAPRRPPRPPARRAPGDARRRHLRVACARPRAPLASGSGGRRSMVTLGEGVRWLAYTLSGLYQRLAARVLRRDQLLAGSERRFRALLEAAPDAMVIVDRHGHIALVNAQAERLFGYARAEIVGQNVTELIPERYRAAAPRAREGVPPGRPRRARWGSDLELFGRRKDGTEIPIEVSLSPLATDQGTAGDQRDPRRHRAQADRGRARSAGRTSSSAPTPTSSASPRWRRTTSPRRCGSSAASSSCWAAATRGSWTPRRTSTSPRASRASGACSG